MISASLNPPGDAPPCCFRTLWGEGLAYGTSVRKASLRSKHFISWVSPEPTHPSLSDKFPKRTILLSVLSPEEEETSLKVIAVPTHFQSRRHISGFLLIRPGCLSQELGRCTEAEALRAVEGLFCLFDVLFSQHKSEMKPCADLWV